MCEQLLTAGDVVKLLACSPRWLRYARDRVPGRVMLGPRAPRWRQSVLLEWIAAGCPDPVRQRAADSGSSEERSGDESDSVQNAGNGAEEIEFTSGVMKHGRRKKVVAVSDERLEPAARATDPARKEMQASLLDCARFRTEYRAAVAAVDEARELVSQGEKNENLVVIRQHAADAIAREIDRRENEFPQRLRRSCPDVALHRELSRLMKKRLATQTRLATASADLQHEQRRWRDREADFRQLGVEGHDWTKVDADAALGTFSVELVGTAATIPVKQKIVQELNELAAEVVESFAMVSIEHADAAAEHQAAMAAFEDCRHRMTWCE